MFYVYKPHSIHNVNLIAPNAKFQEVMSPDKRLHPCLWTIPRLKHAIHQGKVLPRHLRQTSTGQSCVLIRKPVRGQTTPERTHARRTALEKASSTDNYSLLQHAIGPCAIGMHSDPTGVWPNSPPPSLTDPSSSRQLPNSP